MKINYKIGSSNYDILIKDKIDNSISKKINSIKSDKKVLFVYDNQIDQNLVAKIVKTLKESGCLLIALQFQGNKKIKVKSHY